MAKKPSRPATPTVAVPGPRVHGFHLSRFHVADRKVRVWLPRGVGAQRLPVLYLMDGQNVFDDDTAFGGHGWRAHAAAQRLIDKGKLAPMILVGVDNVGEGRIDEYTPERWQGRGGRAEQFAGMLVHEVKPFLDAHYPTLPGRDHTGIAGASLGGLFALHMGITRPELFSRVGALSPSCWWADGAILRRLDALPGHLPLRVWLDAGTRETSMLRDAARSAAEILRSKGFTEHRTASRADLRFVTVRGAKHDELAWRKRVERVLRFLWPPALKPRRSP